MILVRASGSLTFTLLTEIGSYRSSMERVQPDPTPKRELCGREIRDRWVDWVRGPTLALVERWSGRATKGPSCGTDSVGQKVRYTNDWGMCNSSLNEAEIQTSLKNISAICLD